MIGNDIVDLKLAAKDSNWQRPRFLDKVFTEKEQLFISNAEEQHQTVWLLWSMKEAAYKVNVQQFEKRFFNPKRIECELISLEKGSVKIDDEIYFTTSEITEDYVYTIATLNESIAYKSDCFKTTKHLNYKTQSKTLKKRLIQSINIKSLKIEKDTIGIPKLIKKGKVLNTSISLTHHGLFSGYTIL